MAASGKCSASEEVIALVTRIEGAFAALADPARAGAMAAYQRGQFSFLGIQTPARRAALASLDDTTLGQDELLAAVHALWEMPHREYQYAAIDLLARRKKVLAPDVVAPLLALAQQKAWWDSVDGLAAVIGPVIRAHPGSASMMDQALTHESMWVRRIAMTHQLGWRLQTDRERLFGYALALAPEPDFFIRKAIGWALRDYARWAPEVVIAFVLAQRHQLSALSVREALKHHPQALHA